MSIINKITSKDPHQIWEACGDIAQLTDLNELNILASHLEEIKKSTKKIDLGGTFCPNSYHLDFAIKKLEHVKNNQGCLCSLYQDNMFFNPRKEEEKGNILIDKKVEIEGKWIDYYLCHCMKCNDKFKVEEREGHYTWWSWKKIQ